MVTVATMRSVFSFVVMIVIMCVVHVSHAAADECPAWVDHDFRQLHSSRVINLCQQISNKPVLVVNTASHCGFTYQFSGLEKLHQRYKDQGLVVVGFSSNDFNQAAATERKAADICYLNYGVSFTMMAPIAVKGDDAHPLFKVIAEKSIAPSWNFTKFLISPNRQQVQHFGTRVSPDALVLQQAIEKLL
jgi:glutathione peroxidase